jgi:uncharacterized membrane protein (DUF106 family)
MMKEQLEASQAQFKPMAYILLVSIPIFLWLIYKLPLITSTITFPYFGEMSIATVAIWIIPAWILWYMICSVCISQVIRKSMNIGGI